MELEVVTERRGEDGGRNRPKEGLLQMKLREAGLEGRTVQKIRE